MQVVAGHIKSSECLGETETRSRDDGLLCCKTRFPTERKVFFPYFVAGKKDAYPKVVVFFFFWVSWLCFFCFVCLFVCCVSSTGMITLKHLGSVAVWISRVWSSGVASHHSWVIEMMWPWVDGVKHYQLRGEGLFKVAFMQSTYSMLVK